MGQPANRFDVLCEHFDAGVHHGVNGVQAAGKIRGQGLDRRVRIAALYGTHAGCVMAGTPVRQIIPINGCQHHILQPHELHGTGRMLRLVRIQPAARIARVHRTELARPGADGTHQHQRRRAVVPALTDIGTDGFLANGAQAMLAHGSAHALKNLAAGVLRFQPGGFAIRLDLLPQPVALDAVLDGGKSLGRCVLVTRRHYGNAAELGHACSSRGWSKLGVEPDYRMDSMARYRPPQQPGSKYITPEGAARLRSELDELWRVKRPEVTRRVAAAAAEGDRSENAEYIYGKKKLAEIDRRIRFLRKRLDGIRVVTDTPKDTERVFFGAWFELETETGGRQRYRLVGPDEFDAAADYISMDSPLGRAVMGKRLHDELVVELPQGEARYRIVNVCYGKPES